MLKDDLILQKIQKAKTHNNVVVLWLYGSRVKGTINAESDYDLAMAVIEHWQAIHVNDPLRLAKEENHITSKWEIGVKH